MSYIGSDAEQDKPDFRRQRSSSILVTKSTELWNAKREAAANCDDSGKLFLFCIKDAKEMLTKKY